MAREKIKKLLKAVVRSVVTAEDRYEGRKKAAEAMNRTSRTSWSSAGDRVYADGQKQINEENLKTLLKLKKELEKSIDKSISEKVVAPCFVGLSASGKKMEIYLVHNVANIDGFLVISKNSPMGKRMTGKRIDGKIKLLFGQIGIVDQIG